MKGFVLAAGFGTRLKPLTDHIPKALSKVCGVPLLSYWLEKLAASSIESIIVNTHYCADQILAHQKASPVSYVCSHEYPDILGTGGALYHARAFLIEDECCIVCNVDIVTDVNLTEIVQQFRASGLMVGLVATKPAGKGTIYIDATNGAYKGTIKKPLDSQAWDTLDFIGITLYRREFFNFLTSQDFSVVDVWNRLAHGGNPIGVITTTQCYWHDTGTPHELAAAYFDILAGKLSWQIPASMHLDTTLQCAWPAAMGCTPPVFLKERCWIESIPPSGDSCYSNCIILAESKDINRTIDHEMVTPYGNFVC